MDIVSDYEREGREVIHKFVEGHEDDHAERLGAVEARKGKQASELKEFARRLEKARAEVVA